MRHFAHNIGDYAAATAHLSFIEDAAYHRCLRRYYQDEHALPGDVKEVQRLVGARTKEERQAVANVLAEFFHLEGDGYHQDRADREIEVYHAKAKIARENGTKSGGRPVVRSKPKNNPAGYSSVPSGKANHSPVREAPTGLPVTDETSPLVAARESAEGAHAHDASRVVGFLGSKLRAAE
jgi:uncharacterized protein YdaU (DUF1376 family)